jgi:hypothetical protein
MPIAARSSPWRYSDRPTGRPGTPASESRPQKGSQFRFSLNFI